MGALHPVIFFTLVYGISLVMALFVCRTVYYSINGDETASVEKQADYQHAGQVTASLK